MIPGKGIASQIGSVACRIIVLVILAYVGTGIAWMISYEGSEVFSLAPTEPYLTILESLILISAPALILLMLSIHILAPAEKKFFSLGAVVFMCIMTTITSSVHFLQLSIIRHSAKGRFPGLNMYHSDGQLSPWIALDMLAWTFFYGVSLMMASEVFKGGRLQNYIRFFLLLGGFLCVFGVSGPLSGKLMFYFTAPVGFTVVTGVSCILLDRWFRTMHSLKI